MAAIDDLTVLLRRRPCITARDLGAALGISQPSLSRLLKGLGDDLVVLGRARATRYALARSVRGLPTAIPIFEISEHGQGIERAALRPLYPTGAAVLPPQAVTWPVNEAMQDGLFEGLPYYVYDMRPQGFLGRAFARSSATDLGIPDDPAQWSDDDILTVVATLGDDLPGNLIVGDQSYRRYLDARVRTPLSLDDDAIRTEYPKRAAGALAGAPVGSSAGGEFPKFTAVRTSGDDLYDVIVKFSGDDDSPAVRRWSDLLKCEHLAAQVVSEELDVPATETRIFDFGGRTFLEVTRFDRIGHWGRGAACTIGSLDAVLIGSADPRWDVAAASLRKRGLIDDRTAEQMTLVFLFGQLIANSDMHGGNLAMRPIGGRLLLTPIYDMLPMMYAPARGGELPLREYAPPLPFPKVTNLWRRAAKAAMAFWDGVKNDASISPGFRAIADANGTILSRVRVAI